MAVNDIYRFQAEGRLEGQQIITDWFYRVQVEGSPVSSEVNLKNAWERVIKPDYLAALSSSYSMLQYNIGQVSPIISLLTSYSVTLPAMGSQPGDSLPGTVAQVTTKRTGIPGRALRGRFYFAGVAEADAIIGTLTAAALARFVTLQTTLALPISSLAGTTIYVASLRHHAPGSNGTGAIIYTDIINYLARSTLGNQRRRRPGVGR